MMFGPEYTKINTIWKRDSRGVVQPWEYSTPEFEYLQGLNWKWTEKVDGTNIRLHWNGKEVTIGGRTDNAQVPAKLIANLDAVTDPEPWLETFPDTDDVTVYGEGYGAGIQKGGVYREDQAVIVFDVLVGRWWLQGEDVEDVALKLGLETVPHVTVCPLNVAWGRLSTGGVASHWDGAPIEGLVGRPVVDLFNRAGERIITKMKVKDWRDYERRQAKK